MPDFSKSVPPNQIKGYSALKREMSNFEKQYIYGGFHEGEVTWAGVGANFVIGFIPVLGQLADIRDTIAAITIVYKNPKSFSSWGGLVLAIVAWVPGGELLKGRKLFKSKPKIKTNRLSDDIENPFKNLSNKEIGNAIDKMIPEGELLTDLIPHNKATKTRKILRLSGKEYQSMHIAPQSAMKFIEGYNANITLTRLGHKNIHKRWDDIWKSEFKSARFSNRSHITAQELFEVVSDAIRKSPDFREGEKLSMIARLSDEIFVEFGLKIDSLVKRPFAKKIKP